MSVYLAEHRFDVYSQGGEDGMIARALELLPDPQGWCVEFGAWDGRFCSNTHRLMKEGGWHGVFIEPNTARYAELERTYAGNPNAICVNELVELEGDRCLDAILAKTPIPAEFDLLSIDTDGMDWHLWHSLTHYRPKLVIIEFNATIPPDIDFVQESNPAVHQGSSLAALTWLGKSKEYELVAVSEENAFFVEANLFERFEISDNSVAAIHTDRSRQTRVFQLFDGTLVWDGCQRLIWHGVELNDVQVIPKRLRSMPGREGTFRARVWRKLYVAWLRRISSLRN